MKTANKTRLDYIDVSKGIGILLVVLGHLTIPSELFDFIFSFHMPLFFIISGILLFYNNRWQTDDLSFTIKRKIKSILWPYIVFSILAIIVDIGIFKHYTFTENYLFSFFSLTGIGELWFLSALVIGEIVFIVLMNKFGGKGNLLIFIIIIALTALFCLKTSSLYLGSGAKYSLRLLNVINRGLMAYIFVFIGFNVSKIKPPINKHILIMLAAVALILTVIISQFNHADLHFSVIGSPVLFYAAALLGSFSILIFSKFILSKVTFLSFLGINSLIIFVTHRYAKLLTSSLSDYFAIQFLLVVIISTVFVIVINRFAKFLVNFDEFKNIVSKGLDSIYR